MEAYPIKKKSDCRLGLYKFVKEYGSPDKHKEFARVITNEDILEADDIFDPEEFDNYVNTELALDRHDDGPELARINKRLKKKIWYTDRNCSRKFNPRHKDVRS